MTPFRNSLPLKSYYFGLIALLYLPIVVLFLFSINANTFLSFPLQGLTLEWYQKLLASEALVRSARASLIVALGSSLAATVLGTMVALVMIRYRFRSKGLLVALATLTLIVPYIALALFLAGTQPTFPVYLYGQLRFANRLPIMIALAVLMMIGTLTLVLIAERVRRAE